jgi:large subunit ribosomal protein L10
MARPDKASAVAELTTAFRDSSAAVLTEYRGLTVAELKELRRSLEGNATYVVVKNTLSKIAAREAGVTALDDLLVGPSAIAFVSGDPVAVAKGLRAFNREHPLLIIKGGVLDGAPLSSDDIKKLADLESREVLLAKLAGGFIAPATQLASVLMAPVRQLAQVLGALAAKAAADPTWAGGDGASATDPTPAAEAPVEAAQDAASADEAASTEQTPAEASDEAPAEQSATEQTATEQTAEQTPVETTDGVADASSAADTE